MKAQTFPDRASWLRGRSDAPYIGGSDMAVIAGVSPYKSRYALWAMKVAPPAPETMTPQDEPEAAQWGHILEAPCRIELAKRSETTIEARDFTIWRSDVNPAFCYSPDGEVVSPWRGIAEIKTRSAYKAAEWDESIPMDVQVQVQWGLLVSGYERAVVGALIGGQKFVWGVVDRHERLLVGLVEKAEEFLDLVKSGRAPEPDGSESTTWAIKMLHPRDAGTTRRLGEEFLGMRDRLLAAKTEAGILKTEIDEMENTIKAALGDAATGALSDGSAYTWKTQKRKGYVVEDGEARVLRYQAPKVGGRA